MKTAADWNEPVEITIRWADGQTVTVHARKVRTSSSRDGPVEVSFRFDHQSVDTEDQIQQLVLSQLEQITIRDAVLLVDDLEENWQALKREIGAMGRPAIVATTPLEAVRWLEDSRVMVRAILINQAVNRFDNTEILDYLNDEHPDIKRIMLSEKSTDWQKDLATLSGRVHGFLSKPWTRQRLQKVLD
jgi:CheY-like chemotaxis protein